MIMEKVKVVDQFNFVPHTLRIEFTKEDRAITVPDQAYSISDLIERHRAGILTDTAIYKEPVYLDTEDFDDEDMEKLRDSDLVEQEEYLRRASEQKPVDETKKKDRDTEPESEEKDKLSAQTKSSAAKTKQPKGKGLSETEQLGASENVGTDDAD